MGRKIFTFLVTAAFFYIVYPLLFPLAMGGVFAVLFLPWVEKLERRKFSTSVSSAIVTISVTLGLLLPTSVLTYQGVKSGLQQLELLRESPSVGTDWAESLVNSPRVLHLAQWATTIIPIGLEELTGTLSDLVRSVSNKVADGLGGLVAVLPGMALALGVSVVSLYFFLVDGKKVVLFVRRHSVFSEPQTEQLVHALTEVCRSVVLAALVSGACQTGFEVLMILFTGTPNVLLLGMLVFVASFVPLVGTAPITFGVALQQLFIGRTAAGVALLISAGILLMMDNLIRPWFLRGRSNLHPLLAFVAAFGGLQMLGVSGIFLGPIVAALMVATIQVLTEQENSQVTPPDVQL